MSKDTIIEVEHVSKKFCKNLKRSLQYGFADIGKNLLGINSYPERLRDQEFWALKDLSFSLKKGETLGIIGANGSGKSTLLKLINGIFMPDKGKICIRGKVGALIAVGAGFHPMLTGRENIYINGTILGMSKKQIDKSFSDIVEFADISGFLDTPVKNYSSGMYVKLGFSIAIHSNPDILLVDEVLSVGDIKFQRKSINKMQEIIKSEKIIIFVSHNIPAIESFAPKTIYLKNGSIKKVGKTAKVIKEYLADENNYSKS